MVLYANLRGHSRSGRLRESWALFYPSKRERNHQGWRLPPRKPISPTSAFPRRESAGGAGTTAIEDLAESFTILQNQIDVLGRSYERTETVYRPDGRSSRQAVLQIGAFGLIAGGRYLVYSPDADKLVERNRQPDEDLLDAAADYASTPHAAIAPVAIHPTGGQTLQLIVQVPNLRERIGRAVPSAT